MRKKKLQFEILNQGGVIMCPSREIEVVARGRDVMAVFVPTDTKYTETCGCFWDNEIRVSGLSLMLPDPKGSDTRPSSLEITDIIFPDLKGWDIFSARCSKWNVAICFVREEKKRCPKH